MSYGTPTIAHEETVYRADYKNTIGGEGAYISVTMGYANEGGGLTPTDRDELFQELLDHLDGLAAIELKWATRRRTEGTIVTPTP